MNITTNKDPEISIRQENKFRNVFLVFADPVPVFLFSLVVFTTIVSLKGVPWRVSNYPYYNYLADAFLHGQLHLRIIPPQTLDLSLYEGKYFLFWGPLPAIIIMPIVLAFGIGTSDILQSIIVGSMNIGLFALLLQILTRINYIRLTQEQRALFVLFFMLGTMQTPIIMLGSVWYLVQLLSVTFSLLGFLAVFTFTGKTAFFFTGCALSGILLTRQSGIFVAIFLIWYLFRSIKGSGWRKWLFYGLVGTFPCVLSLISLGLYNYLRFGEILNNGMEYHLMADSFRPLAMTYGIIGAHYIPINLYINYIYYPFMNIGDQWLYPMGGSIFLMSPLFAAGFYSLWQDRKQSDTWILFVSFLAGNIPALMIMAPGSWNIGPRYLLDAVIPLLILTGKGIQRWPIWLISIFTAISILQYLLISIMMNL